MSKYLITGATGYIGSMILNRILDEGHEVDVIVRNGTQLFCRNFTNVNMIVADIRDENRLSCIDKKYEYIVHCAAPTQSAYMVSNPVEVIESIVNGTEYILKLAKRSGVKSMVYLSSMEVYGQIDCSDGRRVRENESGYIDVSNIRSCYPIGKLMAENLCHSYYKEYGIPVKIARLAQTFGRGVRAGDNRVFVQFANAVRTGSDIVLHTFGRSMGNYCDIDEAVDAILFILMHGENSEAYNVVNEANTMRIRDLAEIAASEIANGNIKIIYDISKKDQFGYSADTELKLSGEKLRDLGWEAKRGIKEMFERMLTA